ncbi:MAG: hypothetical protein LBS16_01185, partial [Prevotellaceae bacterium]|nr:hypothetical protein [Prevotellaceae bacterium]
MTFSPTIDILSKNLEGAVFMPKKANQLVKESNNLARARIMPATTTVWDERIISSIAARNRVEDTEFHEQTIDARTLAATEKLSTVQFQEVKRSVRALSHKTYEIPSGRRGIII